MHIYLFNMIENNLVKNKSKKNIYIENKNSFFFIDLSSIFI
jgi:hypothetical protein